MTAAREGSVTRFLNTAAIWVSLLCVDALGLLPWARIRFPVSDFAEIVFQAHRLELGFVPYRDTVTHHFLGYAVPLFLIGSAVDLTPLVLKLTTLAFHFATVIFVWLTIRELRGPGPAWLGAFLGATLGWFWSWQGFGFNVQSLLAPMTAAMLYFIVRSCTRSRSLDLHLAALVNGALIACDQRGLVFALLLGVPLLFFPALRRPRIVMVTLAMIAVIPACGIAYLLSMGAWRDFVEQTLIFPIAYRNHGVAFDSAGIVMTWLGTWLGGERFAVPLMLAGLVMMSQTESRRWVTAACVAFAGCAAAYATMGGRPYPNYFMVFAPITLIATALLPGYLRERWPVAGRGMMMALVAFAIVCGLRPILLWASTGSIFLAPTESTIEAAAAELQSRTSPEDKVLVWGFSPGIYVLSNRFHTFREEGLLSVAGANFASSAAEDQALVPHMVREFEEFLTVDPPKVIVVYNVTREPCPGKGIVQRNFDYARNTALAPLRDLLQTSYRSARLVEGACDRAEIFVRRSGVDR